MMLLLACAIGLASIVIALAWSSWERDACGSCGREFEENEPKRRRHVPSAGGKTRYVCQGCADTIDAQETLLEPQKQVAA